jgi:hypothetical protein
MLSRRVNSYGLGSTPFHPVNSLMVARAELKQEGKKLFSPILSQNQWLVESIPFMAMTMYTIRCSVVGQGTGYLYASFLGEERQEVLAIAKVTAGTHELKFRAPFSGLKNFKIGVGNTVPQAHGIRYLSKDLQYRLQTNSLLFNQKAPQYESSGIGFAGLGAALLDINQPLKPGTYQDDKGHKHWDGNLDNYTWSNGYRGPREGMYTQRDIAAIKGSYHGYYAYAMNLHIARFDNEDNFIGWDALESWQSKIPAGVPMCATFQFFVLNSKGEDSGNKLTWKAKEPYWIHAEDYQIPANDFHLAHDSWNAIAKKIRPVDSKGNMYGPRWAKKGDIGIGSDPEDIARTALIESFEWDNFKASVRDVAAKIEWYNEPYGTWSSPQASPDNIPITNSMGLTKVIFRFPRQLDSSTDRDILAELTELGVNYDYASTKKCYPYYLSTGSGVKKAYAVLGRPNPTNNDLTYEEMGDTYAVPRSMTFDLFFKYGKHPKAGRATSFNHDGSPEDGYVSMAINGFGVADAEKFARMNTPEVFSAFYPAGGFTTGGIIAGIGRGFALNGTYAISTKSSTDPFYVSRNTDPYPTGEKIGTKDSSRIGMTGLILSSDLDDGRMAVTEEQLQALWKAKFGQLLTKQFFEENTLPNQDPNNRLNYLIRDPETGLNISAPYQIFYFKLEPTYEGPYYEYESIETTEKVKVDGVEKEAKMATLKITKNPNKDFSMGDNQSIYLCARTPLGYTRSQQFDIVKQVKEQLALIDIGLSPEDALALDVAEYETVDTTATTAEEAKQQAYLDSLTGETAEPPAEVNEVQYGKKKVKWPWEMLKKTPKHYNMEVISGFNGFTNDRDFYVEDVTQKWGMINGLGSAPRDYNTDYTDIMPATNPSETHDPYLSLGAVSLIEEFDGPISRAGNIVAGTVEGTIELVKGGPVAGKVKATNIFFNSEYPGGKPQRNPYTGLREGDSLATNAAKLAAGIPKSAGSYAGKKTGGAIVEWFDTGFSGVRYNPSEATALGSVGDKIGDYGEATGNFVRRTGGALMPTAIKEGFDEGVGSVMDKFNERPVLYTSLALAAVPLLIPGIGGSYARNLSTGVGAAVGGLPKAVKAIVQLPGAIIGGTVDGIKLASGSKPKSTAARRRARRRKR